MEVNMFNGMFNEGNCGDNGGNYGGHGNGNGGCCGGGLMGGCNCTWILLIILFLCCCGGKMRSFSLSVNPCCLILLLGLLYCSGGIKFGSDCK